MKFSSFSFFFALIVAMFVSGNAMAQYDDVYFNPDEDVETTTTDTYYESDADLNDDYAYEEEYDDSSYDYQYSSRIRRFHNP